MHLIDVYEADEAAAAHFLLDLLRERPNVANISHKAMPTWAEHLAFIDSMPYFAWYLIASPSCGFMGSIYLTRADEIGLGILEPWRHQGHGRVAVRHLMRLHPRERYLAHVAPANLAGQSFWLKQDFKPLQVTYELIA